jgi:aldehyde:ferredoxin oxidoreductase
MKILRVNIKNEKVAFENLKDEWKSIGGSAFIAKIMNQEVTPATDPLGPGNLFVVAVGPLAGTGAPQLGRISVGAKSPLTLGIKVESGTRPIFFDW